MKWITIKRLLVYGLVNHLYVGPRCFERKRALLNSVGYRIGEGTKVVGPIYCTGQLTVGENCWVGKELRIHGNGSVIIGDRCDLAPEVTFLTGGHQIGDSVRRAGEGESYTIEIGNGTWVGARACFMRNTRVGDGCVVASCACVTSDVRDNCMVGGVPAKEIRDLNDC